MTQEYQEYLAHHGVKGQKWGVRKYQNEDGTLTEEGKARYEKLSPRQKKQYDQLPRRWKAKMDQKLDHGKSFTRSINEIRKQRDRRTLAAGLAVGAAVAAGAYALQYFTTKGLMTASLKSIKAIRYKMATSQKWHNLKNRVKAMKTGDIVLGKKDYVIGGGWLNGVRR